MASFLNTLKARIATCQDEDEKADLLHKMGVLSLDMDKHENAEPYFAQAFELRKQRLGSCHQDTMDSMHQLGVIYQRIGNFEKAEALLRGNLEEYRKVLGPNARETLQCERSLAVLYSREGKLKESEQVLLECVRDQREVLGADDPETIESELALAEVFGFERMYSAAENVYNECLQKQTRLYGENHPETVKTRMKIGGSHYLHERRDSEASPAQSSRDRRRSARPTTSARRLSVEGTRTSETPRAAAGTKEEKSRSLSPIRQAKRVLKKILHIGGNSK